MPQVKDFIAACLFTACFVITSYCSQKTVSDSSSVPGVFEASTPCDEVTKKMLGIPPDTKCEWMKWNLTLNYDQKTLAPSTYKLICEYGLPKQGTRDFMDGAKTKEFKGKWTISKGIAGSAAAVIYKLTSDSSSVLLSFLNPDQNLLHLLDENNHLMIGNGAWSYTLNRVKPITTSSTNLATHSNPSPRIATDSTTVGNFDGRMPCNNALLALNQISSSGCNIIKCRLTLFQDPKTHSPTIFVLYTIYVGKGDTRYTTTGKWKVTQGTKTDSKAIVYQLAPDKHAGSLTFLKADDNILFFLDKDWNFLVGNNYVSYTLNRN